MTDNTAEVKFGGDASGAINAAKQVSTAVETSIAEMKASFATIGSAVSKIQTAFIGLTAVLAGGAMFKSMITTSNEWALESVKLSKALGTTTEQASIMKVALERTGIPVDTLIGASQKLSKQIFTNSDAFKKMGIDVRDSSGQYRPVLDVMTEANDKLKEIKNPIEQNIAGMQLYGRAWGEIKPLMKLTTEQMEASAKRAKELHLIVGPEGAAKALQYKSQMRDLNLVGKSLEIQFGSAVTPVFVKLGAWMGGEGAGFADLFKTALEGVAKVGITLSYTFQALGTLVGGVAAAIGAALSGNFSGARTILSAVKGDIDAIDVRWHQALADFDKPAAKGSTVSANNGPTYNFGKGKGDESRLAAWEAELAEQKLKNAEKAREEGRFYEMSKAEELKFWQDKLAIAGDGAKENIAVRTKIATVGMAIMKQEYEAAVASQKEQLGEFKNNTDAKLAILDQEAALVAQRYGMESKQYAEVQAEILRVKRQADEQIKKIEATQADARRNLQLAEVDATEQAAQLQVQLGMTTNAELLQLQQVFEARRTQIQADAMAERMAILQKNPGENLEAIATLQAQIEQLWLNHSKRLGQITAQQVVEANKWNLMLVDQVSSGLGQITTAILNGTMRWNQVFQQGMRGLFGIFSNIAGQMVTEWAKTELAKTMATITGNKARTAATAEGEGESLLIKAGAAIKAIMIDAWEAMAGAFNAMVSIPYVGPALAVGAGAAAFALVSGLAGHISAAGGFDVPAGMNPVTQLHQREMVLPAHLADPMRDMLADGGGMGGGLTFNINGIDPRGLKQMLMDNRSAVHDAIKQTLRDGRR